MIKWLFMQSRHLFTWSTNQFDHYWLLQSCLHICTLIKVYLTSTMESTSFLPYQSGSYMSAKHACTFFEDSCIADDSDRWFIHNYRYISRYVHAEAYDYIYIYMTVFISIHIRLVNLCGSLRIWNLSLLPGMPSGPSGVWSLQPEVEM